MAEKAKRLIKLAKELNVGTATIVDFLNSNGFEVKNNPNTKISPKAFSLLEKEYNVQLGAKMEEKEEKELNKVEDEKITIEEESSDKYVKIEKKRIEEEKKPQPIRAQIEKREAPKVFGKLDERALSGKPKPSKEEKKPIVEEEIEKISPSKDKEVKEVKKQPNEIIKAQIEKKNAPKVFGKIDIVKENTFTKKKRKRIKKEKVETKQPTPVKSSKKVVKKTTSLVNEEDIQKQVKDTLAKLTSKTKSKGVKYRKGKRDTIQQRQQEQLEQQEQKKHILEIAEFVTVSELASLMDIQVNEVISSCMSLGLMVGINQRLDAETISLVAEEFGFEAKFVTIDVAKDVIEEEDKPEDLQECPPIVTVMGHVDHGKTSLLDFVRKANVIAGEAGGITQHIGAYSVKLEGGRKITFLDTPGHEAFTAMRARGAQVTDIAIIIVAADDDVMPQTKEAINHATAAGVPIIFAINKIDKPNANPDKIKEKLSAMGYMVEEWGGKYQSQDIAAKTGQNVPELLEKVLLEAELLELKANPNKAAYGTIIESTLDKGRGYVTTLLVKAGTLRIGDILLAGTYTGHVKAMYNEREQRITEVGPSEPAVVLGLNGAPQAGDKFNIIKEEREARGIANKREQLQREQSLRTKKHITLDEIGRRISLGGFQQLNVIVKGDMDGSIEALADSIIKLSTDEIEVNVIHKAVGQIKESDVMLATASDAIIVGFHVRPSMSARQLAEKEQVDIRLYSIIYDAIEEIRSAMEGMLSPETKEEIVATLEIQETFKISKIGTIAGCIVREGKIKRTSNVRIIREGIVKYTGKLGSLKRFKDDAKEVVAGLECGLNIENYNDIKMGDVIEAYETTEVARKL